MADKVTSNCPAEAIVDLTPDQIEKLNPFLETWQSKKGLVIGSLGELKGEYKIGFRQLPTDIGLQIIKIVEDFYKGETNVNS